MGALGPASRQGSLGAQKKSIECKIGSARRFLDPGAGRASGSKLGPGPAYYNQSVASLNTTFADAQGADGLRKTQSTLNPILPGAFKPQNETIPKAARYNL